MAAPQKPITPPLGDSRTGRTAAPPASGRDQTKGVKGLPTKITPDEIITAPQSATPPVLMEPNFVAQHPGFNKPSK